ncbi:DUF4097 family beta strand repeat-containing protein [Deinococcus sp. Leaf326]|uniref:DUF4097 family beta strand repeat-containing protein n=1 Tax=Deinococcus sp. Leaf326 TaxID=1736338 RepID=UPI000AA3D97F|nr:DUF4097 family beta strand repeat-containing protein [Deinococcus sp. Leaf326]
MTLPPPRPLLPVLARMALGLALASVGGLLMWQGLNFRPTPGLATVTTPAEVPLDGPLPLDYADTATVSLAGDRSDLNVFPLPAGSPDLLRGDARHRRRNLLEVSVGREGRAVQAELALYVQDLQRGGVVAPEPVQHRLSVGLTRAVPLTLSTLTSGGDQRLDLRSLRLRALTVRSDSGDLDLTLPAQPGGPLALITRRGAVQVTAPAGASPEALRVNGQSGDLTLALGGARLDALSAGTLGGDVTLTLPTRVNRGSVTTQSGDVEVTARSGTSGNLDIRTQSGGVTLHVPATLRVRVRFTGRDALLLPPGTPPATAPDLDVFVDAPPGSFTLRVPSQENEP